MKELTRGFTVQRWGDGYACEVTGNPLTRAWGATPGHALYHTMLRCQRLTYAEI